ncbi:hypothetical protein FR932_10005 [Moritella marina ATCC 15381]|uniref:Uncharacterized protein n=1 Tax=Moritella marina ATCC 15381 TaxID=1202962 RepID=A0A5J6WJD0_MORMI|nr:hypothetical protein [Moritella marina]QFI38153.1 hypothetical protein FR932_10005 [Moritella marina ATCC 15381]
MITIEQGEWQCITEYEYGDMINTGGLGPCTGIVMHDPVSKIVIAGHFTDPDTHEDYKLSAMISCANSQFTNSSQVNVTVTGRVGDTDSQSEFEESLGTMLSPSKYNIIYEWPDASVDSIDLEIDPESGDTDTFTTT